jgi:uncharacterized protein (TIGR02145 family)
MKTIFKITLVFSIIALFATSCKKDDNNTPAGNGYIMEEHLLETDLPCFVNVMFEVTDLTGRGVPYLTTEDFQVQENGTAVSPTESALTVKNKEGIAYNMKTVLLLDNSASVGSNIEEIKSAAKDLVSHMVSKQEMAIYVFSEEPVLLQDFTSDISALNNAINSISLGYATTNLYGSIIAGASRWEDFYSTQSIEQGFMIAITDGSDTQGTSTLADALAAIGDKKVYTVGLGAEQDVAALKQLGTSGYFELENYSELSDKFIEIQEDIVSFANSFYYLYYMSPKRGDNIHSLRLLIKDNQNTSPTGYIEGEFSSDGFYSVQQGIVLNDGVESIPLYFGDQSYVEAFTYLATNDPSYVWVSSNTDVFTVQPDNDDNSKCVLIATGDVGATANLTVNDISNSLTKTISIEITENPYGELTDNRDGQVYQTIEVDGQTWIAENMKFETTGDSWVYENDDPNFEKYGRLYTYESAIEACPDGWHLPSNNEWESMINFLGGPTVAGGKLKEQGTSHWKDPNSFATNESNFGARPGGLRNIDGSYFNESEKGYFWTSTALNSEEAYFQRLSYDRASVIYTTNSKEMGFSVRCIKD